MRILFHALNYAPEPTGTGKYTAEMAEWLVGRGHAVDVIAAPPHYPAWSIAPEYRNRGRHAETIRGVRVYRVPVRLPEQPMDTSPTGSIRVGTKNRLLLETSYTLNGLPVWIRRALVQNRYDIAVAICPPLQSSLFPFLYSALRGVPWIIHVQDLQVDAAVRLNLLQPGAGIRALYRAESFFLRHAAEVTTITQPMADRIIEKGARPDRVAVYQNWANLDEVRPLLRDNAFRTDELVAGPDDVVVMYAGNMGEKQGLELLLGAAEVLQSDRTIRFALVGNGAARSRLQQQAAHRSLSNVRFLDVQPRERLGEMLAAADVHAVVQKPEAADLVMPSKLTNIFAAGRPVVATAEAGTALYHAVVDSGAGMVTEPLQPAAFAKAVATLASNADQRVEMGRKGRRYAEQNWNRDAIMESFERDLFRLIR